MAFLVCSRQRHTYTHTRTPIEPLSNGRCTRTSIYLACKMNGICMSFHPSRMSSLLSIAFICAPHLFPIFSLLCCLYFHHPQTTIGMALAESEHTYTHKHIECAFIYDFRFIFGIVFTNVLLLYFIPVFFPVVRSFCK